MNNTPDSTRIGAYIHIMRTNRGWPLRELSRRAGGIAVSHLSGIERGVTMPSLGMIQQIAAAFDMGAGDLLTDAGYTNRKPDFIPVREVEWTARFVVGSNGELRYLNHTIREVL